MTENERSGRPDLDHVEDFFAAARRAPPEPSPALLARMLEDADARRLAAVQVAGAAPAGAAPSGLLAGLRAIFGGWQTAGGMVMATAAGVWIGFSGVGGITDAASGYLGATEVLGTVELMPESDVLAFATELEGQE